jgi:hypothetical protein
MSAFDPKDMSRSGLVLCEASHFAGHKSLL